jgi:hypothetical protein
MAAVAPTGNGPFEFTDSNNRQVSIPLTAFTFDAAGNLVVNPAWKTIASTAPADALLTYMRAQGIIEPAPAASPVPAAIIRAVDPGAAGNNIAVTVQNIAADPDPNKTTFDIVVDETENYKSLTTATIQQVVGTENAAGSQPGLVLVKSVVNASGTPATMAKTPLKGGGAGTRASLDILDAGAKIVFTLEARDPGADGDLINLTINTSGTTFSLTTEWNKTSTGLTTGTFPTQVASDLGYEVTAAAPAGGIFSVPRAATTHLTGGAGTIKASAILAAG